MHNVPAAQTFRAGSEPATRLRPPPEPRFGSPCGVAVETADLSSTRGMHHAR